jgi:hypothetical protein
MTDIEKEWLRAADARLADAAKAARDAIDLLSQLDVTAPQCAKVRNAVCTLISARVAIPDSVWQD